MARDITGERSGKLIAIRNVGIINGRTTWLCKCDCGNERLVTQKLFVSNHVKSCGCLKKESARINGKKSIKHNDSFSPLYHSWSGMKSRCNNPNDKSYKNYGGRGITVCKEWNDEYLSFRNWAINNGYEKGLTIDRIDVNGNYEPSNCRWSTIKQQENNRRNNRYIEIDGVVHTMTQWAEMYGIPWATFQRRLDAGMSPKLALTKPIQVHRRKCKDALRSKRI